MENTPALYVIPYDVARLVVCLDEKSVRFHADTRPLLPPVIGHSVCHDYEYAWRGTTNLFGCVEPLASYRQARATYQHIRHDDIYLVRQLIDEAYLDAPVIRMVQDNMNTYTPASLYETFPPAEARRLFHYTPVNVNWFNMVEVEVEIVVFGCSWLKQRAGDQCGTITSSSTANDTRFKPQRILYLQT